MLIRLLPASPNPSVLFNITFEDLPDGLTLPQTWTTHLSNLMHDELPMPRCHHVLDKASFLPCILEEVVFDMPALSVRCRFIDGSIEHWKINLEGSEGWIGAKCLRTLKSVVDDVCLSTLESEREMQKETEREKERERQKEKERLRVLQQASPPSAKGTKHKKKRSLLMTIVSGLSSLNSIINLSLPSPTISAHPSTSSKQSQVLSRSIPSPSPSVFRPPTPPPQNICPRFLRRRARSSLVDAFRLYILYELNQRVPQGGYYVWVLHSLLKEARERREAFLARERERERDHDRLRLKDLPPPYQPPTSPGASSTSSLSSSSAGSGSAIIFGRRRSNLKHMRGPSIETETFSPTTASEPPPSDDEEEAATLHGHAGAGSEETEGDTETVETDTDGSSIHTPTSSHFALPSSPNLPSTPASQDLPSLLASPSAASASYSRPLVSSYPPAPPSNPTDLQIQTLTHLILLHNSHSARTAHDEATRLDALEVRGRRRAWLNRALCANGLRLTSQPGGKLSSAMQRMEIGMGAGHGGLGFAVPIRRSGLGMWVVSVDDLQSEQEQACPLGSQLGGERSVEQMDAIMLEEDEVQLVGGERFHGYDERNGVEPKRMKIAVPSKGAQLFPVNEVGEEETEIHRPSRRPLPEPSESAEHSDDDDAASIKFDNLNLNQYDDLQDLQMDLDVVTGVGFDLTDSSDEDDGSDSELLSARAPVNSPNTDNDMVEGGVPEGGLCVTFDIPKPKALHARAPHLHPSHEQRQRQRQRQRTNVVDQGHPMHDCSYPVSIPQRSSTPTPQFPPPRPSELLSSSPTTQALSSGPVIVPISVPQPAHLRASTPQHAAGPPGTPTRNVLSPSSGDVLDTMFHPSLTTKHDFESCIRASVVHESVCRHEPLVDADRQGVHANEMGELVAVKSDVGIALDEGGEEFTLAMDLPSKSLTSRLSGMSFAAIGRTQSFRGRVRGALRARGSHSGIGKNIGGIGVVLEEAESGLSWA